MDTLRELCSKYGYTQTEIAKRFGIPLRTVQHWAEGTRKPPQYVLDMMEEILERRDRHEED